MILSHKPCYHTIPCHAMPCLALPCHTLPYLTLPYLTVPYRTTPYCTTLHHATPYQTAPHNTTPSHTPPTLPHAPPYPTLLYPALIICMVRKNHAALQVTSLLAYTATVQLSMMHHSRLMDDSAGAPCHSNMSSSCPLLQQVHLVTDALQSQQQLLQ